MKLAKASSGVCVCVSLMSLHSGSHIRITGECFRNTDGWVPSWRDSDLIGLRVFFLKLPGDFSVQTGTKIPAGRDGY